MSKTVSGQNLQKSQRFTPSIFHR